MDSNSLAHTKWNCKYHIVFTPKYRCRFVNDVLHNRKRSENLPGRAPAEGTHGEIVVFVLPYCKLFLEVLERIELM